MAGCHRIRRTTRGGIASTPRGWRISMVSPSSCGSEGRARKGARMAWGKLRDRRPQAPEDALRRSERFLAEAQRLSKTGSFIWNTATDERVWSEEIFRVLEVDPTLTPSLDLFMSRVHPDDRLPFKERMARASEDGKPYELELRLVMPDGSLKYLHIVASAVRENSGGFEYIGTGMDVTATTLAFEEIKQLKDKLYQENIAFKDEIDQSSMFEEIVGTSEPLRRVLGTHRESSSHGVDRPCYRRNGNWKRAHRSGNSQAVPTRGAAIYSSQLRCHSTVTRRIRTIWS